MDDDQTCPESVLLVLMERAFRGPTHEGVRTLDWQPQLKRVLKCVRENDPIMVTAVARRYLDGYDEHPAIQAADAALAAARKGEGEA